MLKLPAGGDPRTLTCKKKRKGNGKYRVLRAHCCVCSHRHAGGSASRWEVLKIPTFSASFRRAGRSDGLVPFHVGHGSNHEPLENGGDGARRCLGWFMEALGRGGHMAGGVSGVPVSVASQWGFNPSTPSQQVWVTQAPSRGTVLGKPCPWVLGPAGPGKKGWRGF